MGPVDGGRIIRSYKADGAIPAGVAVIGGAAVDSVALPGGANVNALGIALQAAVNAGDLIPVQEHGETKAIADAAIARGDYVMVNAATGKLAPIAAVAGTNYHVVGKALEAAAAQNSEFTILVNQSRAQG